MIGASIETTRELWASSLREVKKRIRPLFAQERAALNAGLFVDGLLGDERRKTGWMRAEAAGDPGPWRQQAVLGRDRWDADALRDLVRDYATEHLADENAVLVIDETGFLKQGKASYGVARQYTGVSLVMLAFAMMLLSNIGPTSRRPKKPSRAQRQDIRSHPLVDPGNPPHSSTSRAKTHSTRRCHRMVTLAARSSGRSTEISSQTKITTVMLEPIREVWIHKIVN